MTFYGLSVYDRCKKLLEIMQKKNINEINVNDLAILIAQYIGSSKFYKTVRNYIDYMVNFKMITLIEKDKYKINYDVLND